MNKTSSEAAIARLLKNWSPEGYFTVFGVTPGHIRIENEKGRALLILDLREFVRKRQPLTGIKKQVGAIVRGKRKK